MISLRHFRQPPGHENDALTILDTYRTLSPVEQERLQGFAYDAVTRQNEPEQENIFVALEEFRAFVREFQEGVSQEATCQLLALSPDQYARYLSAWRALSSVQSELKLSSTKTH